MPQGQGAEAAGRGSAGVLTAVDFLVNVNLGVPLDVGERVVVIGGGNVAFDVARTARRFGGTSQPGEEHHNLAVDSAVAAARLLHRKVTLVSLEAADEMPADVEEIHEASHEGVALVHRRGPRAVLGDRRVRALQTVDVSRVFDEQGRFSPRFVENSEREIPCDTVVMAVGQIADLSFLGADHGLQTTPQQTITVDRATMATSLPGVFAGGDVAFGPRIIIEAVADGRRAARGIDTFLTGRTDAPPEHVVRVFSTFGYEHPFARGDYERIPRRQLPLVDVEARELREVELRLPACDAAAEGSRCLHCWVNTIFDSSAVQGTECIQCGGCVDVCPEQCIDLVAIRRVAAASDTALAILPNGAPASILTTPNGAVLLKDETACIRCGLCARRCPAGTITMQAFYRTSEAAVMRAADAVI